MASPFRHFRLPVIPRPPARALLALEPLEDRTVPAAIFTVNTLTDDNNPANALLSLREAITAANTNADADVITFAAGLTGTIDLTVAGLDDTNAGGDLDILNPVSIQGPGAKFLRVKQTVANERVFDVLPGAGPAISISGLTISGGNGANGGGDGGGVRINGANLTLSGVEVTDNQAPGVGGGVFVEGGVVTIANSTIASNRAAGVGGGVAVIAATLNLDQSTISGNSSYFGGGIVLDHNVTANLRNATITANTSTNVAGGGVVAITGSTTTLTSTIVAGNTGARGGNDVLGTVQAGSANNLIGNGTGLAGISNGVNGNLVGTAATPINPLLGLLQLNGGPTRTHALLPGSQAVDHGSNPAGLTADQRGVGFPRLSGAGVDIGALEAPAPPPLPSGQVQPPTAQALQAAVGVIHALQPAGARLAAFAMGDVNGDFVSDIVVALRLRNNQLLLVTFDGVSGKILGVFQPFARALLPGARVQLVTLNLVGDAALEIGLIVNSGGPGVPHISAFTKTGGRVL
jgi:CSLREA domain-containing protein